MDSTAVNLTDFSRHEVCGTSIDVVNRYSGLELLGIGNRGIICAARDSLVPGRVAIKKISNPFQQPQLAQRTTREIRLLRRLKHDNILTLHDIFVSPVDDVYIVTELMSTNLEKLISSGPLENQFIQYFFYQIMRGLKYVHSAGVIHRDLNPTNILVNEQCDLKICDFGLARTEDFRMTGYVTKRYYRAPETMLTWQQYSQAVDIWSAACILSEMVQGAPLFQGRDSADQFHAIVNVIGSVPPDVIETICTKNGSGLETRLNKATPEAIDILRKMLVYNPRARVNAATVLEHPYLSPYHDPSDEPVATEQINWSSEVTSDSVDSWRLDIYSEIMDHLGASLPMDTANN
ncbi:hypothetical protein PENSTE_c001G03333 [Penicillium steckii]|uniref:mitogen-activated protein kinase n=1 Tax=Penicillium steckii TaxID=303698 RepID=A0A1V6U0A7_9EURO|nr:hypothetical protein PENSTE_c001G03333 [Penicillium steckii]